MLSGLGSIAVEQEVGQERLLTRGIQAQEGFSVIDQVKITQQLDLELFSQGQRSFNYDLEPFCGFSIAWKRSLSRALRGTHDRSGAKRPDRE